jgi:hypothetical protein
MEPSNITIHEIAVRLRLLADMEREELEVYMKERTKPSRRGCCGEDDPMTGTTGV